MLFAQNDSDLQSHKEIIYAFVSKDKRFFSEYQKELTRNLPLYPSLWLLFVDFAVILVENFDELSEQDKLEIFSLIEKNIIFENIRKVFFHFFSINGFIKSHDKTSSTSEINTIFKAVSKDRTYRNYN